MLRCISFQYRHQEFQFPLLDAAHCGTESEHQVSPADLCLTGLQIATNQRATRKCIWGSIHSRAFREGEFTVLRNSGILFLTVQHLSNFAYDTRGLVKDMRLLKLNVLFMLR